METLRGLFAEKKLIFGIHGKRNPDAPTHKATINGNKYTFREHSSLGDNEWTLAKDYSRDIPRPGADGEMPSLGDPRYFIVDVKYDVITSNDAPGPIQDQYLGFLNPADETPETTVAADACFVP